MSRAIGRSAATWLLVVAVVVGAIVIWTWAQAGVDPAAPDAGVPRATATGGLSRTSAPSATSRPGSLEVVALADLPPEASATVKLVREGGPYPYRQDGAVFQNRERHLPGQPSGYYREYTVPTPGSPDRGARRIVSGAGGDLYWSPDHYDSFVEIAR